MGKSVTYEEFAENLNTKFRTSVDGASADGASMVELDLAEVSELKLSPKQEQFSVLFRGPRDRFLGQGTRSLEHDKLGQAELFLVPVREDAEGYYYEAVFNRFRK